MSFYLADGLRTQAKHSENPGCGLEFPFSVIKVHLDRIKRSNMVMFALWLHERVILKVSGPGAAMKRIQSR